MGRGMAKTAGVSLRSVQRIWAAHRLAPHRPRFFEKFADVVGLYVDPPAHARAVDGREEPDPGPRPHSTRPADETRPRRQDDSRLQTPRHDDALRRPRRARRRQSLLADLKRGSEIPGAILNNAKPIRSCEQRNGVHRCASRTSDSITQNSTMASWLTYNAGDGSLRRSAPFTRENDATY